ncbi:MAG: hypothetical protein H6710_14455 [Myxococcales bacterium]|nr:hypothetical protein [Myxococcales bacterium]
MARRNYLISNVCVGLVILAPAGDALAGTISAQGAVTALTDVNQLQGVVATADYDDGTNGQNLPLAKYTPDGMTFYTGTLSSILNGVTTPGTASNPIYQNNFTYFPGPIAGGGIATGLYTYFGGAVKFDDNLSITQFGLTAGRNGTQYIDVWDKNGQLIGQVTWQPNADAAFVGVDTMGVPIGMLTYGNDNLWAGATYSIGGSTIMSDTWIWAKGIQCQEDADCDDGDLCNGMETCVENQCVNAPEPLNCDDQNVCTDDSCDAVMGCVNEANVAECDDGDACTEMDVCADGVCGGAAVECGDDNACTMDSCDMIDGCVNEPIDGCCLSDADCIPDEEMCNLDLNVCEPVAPMTTTDGTTTDGTTTDTTAGLTDGSTGGSTTGFNETTGGGSTGGSTGGTSDSGSGSGGSDTATTSGGASGTTAASGSATDSATTGDTAGVDESGCGCTSGGSGDAGGLLGLLGVVWFTRRRRSA